MLFLPANSLLRKFIKVLRLCILNEADAVTCKIRCRLMEVNARSLFKTDQRDIRQL